MTALLSALPMGQLHARNPAVPPNVHRAEIAAPQLPSATPVPVSPSPEEPRKPLTIKVEPVALKLDKGEGPATWTYWVPVVGPLISGLLAMFGIWLTSDVGRKNTEKTIDAALRTNEASFWQKANESELKEITAKLDGFYGPFQQLSQANYRMIEDSRNVIQKNRERSPHFSTKTGWPL